MTVTLAPSILSADFGNLGKAVDAVESVAQWLHIDVMDGHFVPNLTVGPAVVASLRPYSTLSYDCHLMVTDPWDHVEAFKKAGADGCTVHVEVGRTDELLDQLRALDLRVGLAINPETPFEALVPYLDRVDLVLCMTVHPGFGGQRFMGTVVEKIGRVHEALVALGRSDDVALEVDGGIDVETAPIVVAAGANVLVAGSAIFGASDPTAASAAILAAAKCVPLDKN